MELEPQSDSIGERHFISDPLNLRKLSADGKVHTLDCRVCIAPVKCLLRACAQPDDRDPGIAALAIYQFVFPISGPLPSVPSNS